MLALTTIFTVNTEHKQRAVLMCPISLNYQIVTGSEYLTGCKLHIT